MPDPAENVAPYYERLPFILYSALTSIAASVQTNFADGDLRNDTGFDLEIWEVGFHLSGQEADASPATTERPDSWQIQITDLSRNQAWMKNQTIPGVLIDVSGSGAIGTKWKLRRPTIIPANGSLRVTVLNNIASQIGPVRIAFIGFTLIPVIAGTRFDEAVQHADAARPHTSF